MTSQQGKTQIADGTQDTVCIKYILVQEYCTEDSGQHRYSLHILWNTSSSGLTEHEYNGQYFFVEVLEVLVFVTC